MNALHIIVIRRLNMGRLSMEQLVNELIEADVGRVLVNEPLARYTTMKIGTSGYFNCAKACSRY